MAPGHVGPGYGNSSIGASPLPRFLRWWFTTHGPRPRWTGLRELGDRSISSAMLFAVVVHHTWTPATRTASFRNDASFLRQAASSLQPVLDRATGYLPFHGLQGWRQGVSFLPPSHALTSGSLRRWILVNPRGRFAAAARQPPGCHPVRR